MTFAKENAGDEGFNRWTINGVAYPMTGAMTPPTFHLHEGRRYRVRMRNESDDLHPIHLHRHTFELTNIMGKTAAGVMKDVVMLGGYQEVTFDFVEGEAEPHAERWFTLRPRHWPNGQRSAARAISESLILEETRGAMKKEAKPPPWMWLKETP